MKRITHVQQVVVVAALFLVGAVVAYWFVQQHIAQLEQDLVLARQERSVLTRTQERMQAMEQLVQQTTQERAEMNTYLLSLDDPLPFLKLIENLGVDTHVGLTVDSLTEERVDDRAGSTAEGQKYVHLVLLIAGDWAGIYHLIDLLESLPYIAVVDKAIVEQSKAGEGPGWHGQVHLRVGLE